MCPLGAFQNGCESALRDAPTEERAEERGSLTHLSAPHRRRAQLAARAASHGLPDVRSRPYQ